MIYKPDQKVMMAFAKLRGDNNFKVITEYLSDCLARTDEDGSKAKDDYRMRWCQGQSQDLREFLKLVAASKLM